MGAILTNSHIRSVCLSKNLWQLLKIVTWIRLSKRVMRKKKFDRFFLRAYRLIIFFLQIFILELANQFFFEIENFPHFPFFNKMQHFTFFLFWQFSWKGIKLLYSLRNKRNVIPAVIWPPSIQWRVY